jgi:hypothetical protein
VFKFILLPELNRILAWFTTVVPVLNQVFYRLQTALKQTSFIVLIHNSITVCPRTDVNRTKTQYRNRSKTRFVYSKCAEKQNTRCFTRYLCLQCSAAKRSFFAFVWQQSLESFKTLKALYDTPTCSFSQSNLSVGGWNMSHSLSHPNTVKRGVDSCEQTSTCGHFIYFKLWCIHLAPNLTQDNI